MSGSISASAPGKVNLYFAVGDVQENGYHPVASLYAAVSLEETVTVTASENPGISLSLEIPANSLLARMEEAGDFDRTSVPLDERNLAYRAASAVLEAQGVTADIHLHIVKNVPVAGGMAGGSADAAAALKAVNLYLLEAGYVDSALSTGQLMRLGARLGADVPFCVLGGLAVGYGVGEELTPLELPAEAEPLNLVMVLNDRGLSTPAVFAELDAGRASGIYPAAGELEVPASLLEALASVSAPTARLYEIARELRNDLQAPALTLAPELEKVLGLQDESIVAGFVSGSGPTIALLLESQEDAAALAAALNRKGRYAVAITSNF